MDFKIIVIDDNMSQTDPFIRRFQKTYSDVEVSLFQDANKGVKFILQNLSVKMIVFLDCKFDMGIQGMDALRKIREKTSLLYIIMMSANSLFQLPLEDVIEMINNEGIYFINNSDTQKADGLIKEIRHKWETHFDCVLEQWLQSHKVTSIPVINRGGIDYSLNDILNEVRLQTGFGKEIEQLMYKSTILSLLEGNLDS